MIKFRAWDKESKTMGTVRRITWTNGDITDVYLENIGLRRLDQVILMQYTGLKDKNCVKIYKDDILNFVTTEFNGSYFDTEHTEKVEFSNGTYFVGRYDLGEILLDDLRAEVIGNIHKNPEFLEVAE